MDEPERMAFIIPKHNDRSFDIANSEHIDEERAKQNLILGLLSMASAISKIPKRKMSCLPLLKMWNSFFIVSGIVICDRTERKKCEEPTP